MAITCRRVSFLLLGILVWASCDQHDNPVSPVSPTPLPSTSAPVALTIAGATSLDHPGATGQLLATATFSDNTSKDVTAEASWVGTDGFVSITGPGLITAVGYGTG